MLDWFHDSVNGFGTALNGIALGASLVVLVISPNVSFDRLDASRADGYVRQLLRDTSTPLAGILLAAGAFCILGGAYAAGACSLLSAFGFFLNRWMLAGRGKVPDGVKTSRKGQRVMAVSLSLVFTLMIAIATVLSVLRL